MREPGLRPNTAHLGEDSIRARLLALLPSRIQLIDALVADGGHGRLTAAWLKHCCWVKRPGTLIFIATEGSNFTRPPASVRLCSTLTFVLSHLMRAANLASERGAEGKRPCAMFSSWAPALLRANIGGP